MYAVNIRAYEAASILFEHSLHFLSNNTTNYTRDLLFTNLIFPLGSRTDQSPLYVLCSNDTCSFTWTGDNHITQDIFECRTCSLVGNLCCCTECARTCHKGHDCKIKTSSPTAYCDCWEKCKCKSLIAGDQEKRFALLERLLTETNLLTASNFRGESLLIYLVQTVSRQIQEQRNYKRISGAGGTLSSNSSTASSNSSRRNGYNSNSESNSTGSSMGITGNIGDMPQHDLEPPKFSRRALEKVFSDWNSVKQIFLFKKSRLDSSNVESESACVYTSGNLIFDESLYSDVQSGCVDLDKFVYALVMKCPAELVSVLVDTVQKHLSISEDNDEMKETEFIVRRLVRAISRLFVILCIEAPSSSLNANLSIGNGTALSTLLSNSVSSTHSAQNRATMSPTKAAINSRLARFKSLSSSSGNQGQQQHAPERQIASLVTISPIAKCEYILRQFAKYSVQELADTAHSLIIPVILGVAKPATFKLSVSGGSVSGNQAGCGNSFSGGSQAGSADYLSIGGSGFSNQYALVEDVFNIELPIQRQFSSLLSTTLITPIQKPVVTDQDDAAASSKTSGFRNTFESVKTTKKIELAVMPPPPIIGK